MHNPNPMNETFKNLLVEAVKAKIEKSKSLPRDPQDRTLLEGFLSGWNRVCPLSWVNLADKITKELKNKDEEEHKLYLRLKQKFEGNPYEEFMGT